MSMSDWRDLRRFPGQQVALRCGACLTTVWVGTNEEYPGSGPGSGLRCIDCQDREREAEARKSPEQKQREWEIYGQKMDREIAERHARWARQDAARGIVSRWRTD